jgi:hypothetical protein
MATIAEWLQGVIDTMQEKANAKYQDDLSIYRQACEDWITANVANRDTGLPLTQFTRTAPARVVFGVDDKGNITQTSVADPGVKAPVLPAKAAVAPAVTFTTGAPAQSRQIDEIHMMVSTIYSAMGFKGGK